MASASSILPALCCAVFASLLLTIPHARAQVSIDVPASADSDAPITGKPYEAEKIMHTRRVLADGTVTTRDIQIHEARDSQGRVLVEMQTTLPSRANGPATSLVIVTVHDPAARTELLWNNLHPIATRTHIVTAAMRELRAKASGKPLQKRAIPAKPELLGQRMIDGRMTTGRFTEKPVPAGVMGNATATVDKREWWTDEALHLVVLSTSSSPLHGEQTTELKSLKLTEPDPARFQPPDGYTIHDIAPPSLTGTSVHLGASSSPPPLDLAHAPALSHTDAMLKLSSGDNTDKAIGAAVLIKEAQASSDISLKADIAYSLARYDIGLPEAQQLAEEALHSIETTTSIETPGKVSSADFDRETTLSRYWDALGFIYFRQGQDNLAKQYIQSAWLLDPRGYYALHLGRLDEDLGDTAAAIRIYREALAVRGSDGEKQTVRHRIAALSSGPDMPDTQSELQPIQPLQPELEDVKAPSAGTAFFDLIYSAADPIPQAVFVSGARILSPLATSIAKSAAESFTLPDKGPEIVARRLELTCRPAGASACRIQFLAAQQASDILPQ